MGFVQNVLHPGPPGFSNLSSSEQDVSRGTEKPELLRCASSLMHSSDPKQGCEVTLTAYCFCSSREFAECSLTRYYLFRFD